GEKIGASGAVGSGSSSEDNPIQRFEAPGHEAAERKALTEKRADGQEFSSEEASMTYFGNWMRDMNQIMVPAFADAIGNDGAFALIKILALKKFGREINPELFGYYIPSEHIDNPAGQVPGADYFTSAPTVSPDLNNAKEKDRFNTQDYPARPSQYATSQENTDPLTGSVLGANIFSVDDSGVMAYIRRTNLHVEKRLELAALKGRTSEGLVHFGAAMHAVEDLFSHSNYVEIALNKILQENPALKSDGSPGLLPELTGDNRQVQTLSSKTSDGRPTLVTGTFTSLDTLESVGSEGVKMLRMGLAPTGNKEEKKAQEALVSASLKKMETLKSNPVLRTKMVKAIKEQQIPIVSGFDNNTIDTAIQYGNVSDLYNSIREINKLFPFLNILGPVHDLIVLAINDTVLKPTADRIESQMLGVKVQDTPLYKGKKEVDEIVNSGGNKFSPVQEMTASITGVAPDPKKNLADAQKRQALLNNTPSKVLANASHSQLAKDHTNSIFFGLAFKLAVEADKKLRDKMLSVWAGSPQVKDPHVEEAKAFREEEAKIAKDNGILNSVKNWLAPEPSDNVKMAEARSKQESESLKFGKEVYAEGKKPGQEYNLQEMRDDSANRILAISATIKGIANAPGNASQSIGELKKAMGNNKIDNEEANKVLDRSMKETNKGQELMDKDKLMLKLKEVAGDFDRNAVLVRNADTLTKREFAYNELNITKKKLFNAIKAISLMDASKRAIDLSSLASLIVLLDREMAILAPAYTSEQLQLLNDPSPAKALPRSTIVLPSLSRVDSLAVDDSKKQAIKDLLQTSREIIDHPFDSTWWRQHVISFINQHHDQILEEIKARNAGYANFGGEHHH
ncbi:HET-C-related protein, partial [Sporocytophaga myxococcoides]|uniref:HET-C-related protein n=1 Tax=Sporocytophaga myxococcoides TaxID=153721 RepID=UPI0005EF77D0